MSDPTPRFPTLVMARRNIKRTQVRSALATVGIVIAVIAIASLGIFGTSLEYSATQSLQDMGSDLVISPALDEGVESLSERDLQRIEQSTRQGRVVRVRSHQARVKHRNDESIVSVYGMSDPAVTYDARDGTIPDQYQSGAIVGAEIAGILDIETGDRITVDGRSYSVVAVLERKGSWSVLRIDSAVIVPLSDVGGEGYDRALVTAPDSEAANESAVAIRETVNRREKRVDILEMEVIRDRVSEFFDTLNMFLIGIGGISLVVAGVSILNVMLMSVMERREEIGVLRAVGYRKRDVLKILLAEALALGVIGGLIGILLSIVSGLAINTVTLGDPMVTFRLTNIGYMLLAFTFGVVTSVVSGIYPAWKAANERPVEALRT